MAFVCNYSKNYQLRQLGRTHPGVLKPSLWDNEGVSTPFLLGK